MRMQKTDQSRLLCFLCFKKNEYLIVCKTMITALPFSAETVLPKIWQGKRIDFNEHINRIKFESLFKIFLTHYISPAYDRRSIITNGDCVQKKIRL